MVRHRKRRKKNSRFPFKSSKNNNEHDNYYYSRFIKNNVKHFSTTLNSRYHHPYATRSKTSNTELQQNINNNNENLKTKNIKNSDNNSIIYLGAYKKVPRLIDLETTINFDSDGNIDQSMNRMNKETFFKMEPIVFLN
ncbi:GATA zinc finger domain-containing protein 8-like [Microplitis mediator]|uniref:GATA zinc finger domain-containing protein 8-like n=1 Tax=Microplitis mediator TaxID=375433 RepID=UPI002555B8B7|nr:GATA zinc finger domain-containing protein 8-like [Microplitis mediator]